MTRLVIAALAAAALLLPASASAFVVQPRGGLESPANGIVLGPDGNLWAAESAAGKVVRMTPAGQVLERFTVGSNPTSLATGPGGRVWVAVTGADKLVWIDATSAAPTTHDLSTAGISDCGPVGIDDGGDGRMYFTAPTDGVCVTPSRVGYLNADGTGGLAGLNKPRAFDLEVVAGKIFLPGFDDGAIYRLSTAGGLPIESDTQVVGGGAPDGVVVDGSGTVWVTLFTADTVARMPVGQTNGSATVLTPPGGALVNPFGIVAAADGIYVTGSESANVVRIDPATNAFTVYGGFGGKPWQIVSGPDQDLWFTDLAFPRLLRFVNSAPRTTTGTAAAASATTANLAAKVDPRGNATTVVFDYGPTTAYGASTAPQTVPTGADPVDVAGSLSGLSPSTTYHVRVRATNSEGESAGADTTFTTPAAPVVATPPAPTPLAAKVAFGWKVSRAYTRLAKFRIEKLVGGETARIKCKGGKKKGCPFTSKTYANLKAGTKNLLTPFKKRKLRPGVVITVTVTKPGSLGRQATLTVRKRKAPKVVRRVLSS